MLIDVYSVMQITNDKTGKRLNIAFTKEEYEKYVSNGKLSEKFMIKTFDEYNISQYKRND